jgi:hypothetical protein
MSKSRLLLLLRFLLYVLCFSMTITYILYLRLLWLQLHLGLFTQYPPCCPGPGPAQKLTMCVSTFYPNRKAEPFRSLRATATVTSRMSPTPAKNLINPRHLRRRQMSSPRPRKRESGRAPLSLSLAEV